MCTSMCIHTQTHGYMKTKTNNFPEMSNMTLENVSCNYSSRNIRYLRHIFVTTTHKVCFMGLHSLMQMGRWGRFSQVDAGYSHASCAHDNASFPCMFLSARNSTIIDNKSLNHWQCYLMPLLPSLNTDYTLLWHGTIHNIFKFSMINEEFSASS